MRTLAWALFVLFVLDAAASRCEHLIIRAQARKLTVLWTVFWFTFFAGGVWAFFHLFTVRP